MSGILYLYMYRQRLVAGSRALFVVGEKRGVAYALPQRLALDRKRRHLVEIGRKPQVSAEALAEPVAQRRRDARKQRQHGLAVERAVGFRPLPDKTPYLTSRSNFFLNAE